MVAAMAIFGTLIAPLTSVMTASVAAQRQSRERTLAVQTAQSEVEKIRGMSYTDVGLPNGNPAGNLTASKSVTLQGLKATVTTSVVYVNDPVSAGYPSYADYKKVTIVVARTSDSKQLAREVTYVAPEDGTTDTNGVIKVQVVDYALRSGVSPATVSLATGPSAPRSDSADPEGNVLFPDVAPGASSGSQYYYDVSASATGYTTLSDDLSPSGTARVHLVAGQTWTTVLQVYKPAVVTVNVKNSNGTPYSGTANVTLCSSRGCETYAVTGGTKQVTSINGELVVPGLQYTATTSVTGPLFAGQVKQVPNNYPVDLTSTFNLTLGTYTTRTLTVNVKKTSGSNVTGASVVVTGGPVPIYLTGSTNSSGNATFTIPSGNSYSVTATSGSLTGTWSGNVTSNTTANVVVK
jgi:hypothetical protein